MKFGFLVFCLIIFSCKQKESLQENKSEVNNSEEIIDVEYKSYILDYLQNPEIFDTMCINAVNRARKDLKEHKGVYVEPICLGCESLPYIDEIEEIVENRDYKFAYEDFGCVIFEGQTQGCYSGYVELEMKKKFGESIFESIHKEAEDLFIKNITTGNEIVSEFHLEEKDRPQSLILNDDISNEHLTIYTSIPIDVWSHETLFLDMNFVVEKDGALSNFEANNWVIDEKENEKFKSELFNFIVAEMKLKYNKWKPGNYKQNTIRTQKNLRVHFKKLYQ